MTAVPEPESETPRDKTKRLLADALGAAATLSEHLNVIGDKSRMYKVNQAIWKLWEVE